MYSRSPCGQHGAEQPVDESHGHGVLVGSAEAKQDGAHQVRGNAHQEHRFSPDIVREVSGWGGYGDREIRLSGRCEGPESEPELEFELELEHKGEYGTR